MFALGHLGIGVGLAWILSLPGARRPAYRLVLLGTLLPDLIDKPLGAALGLESRLWAHTLVFLAALLVLAVVPSLRAAGWLGFGVATHLLLDLVWEQPGVALWPAFGWSFPAGAPTLEHFWYTLLHDPYVQVGEAIGFTILVAFAWIQGIHSWSDLRAFLRKGALRGAGAAQPATADP